MTARPPEFEVLHVGAALSRWSVEEAVQNFGPGVASAASTEGLHGLRAAYPEVWHRLVAAWTPELRSDRRMRLRELLESRFCEQAMPRHAGDYERVCRYRRAARRLLESLGDPLLVQFDEGGLEELRHELVGGGCSASIAARTVSYLRVALRRWSRWQRVWPLVADMPSGPGGRAGGRAVRRFARPETIARLLPALNPEQRAMVALAAGGLLQSEFLALRVEDVWREHRAVYVHSGGIRGRAGVPCDRYEYLPGWAWELLEASRTAMGRRTGLLFPPRGGGERPRASAARGLRRACDRVFGEGRGVTFASIRDLWQEVLRRGGAPRALVRQTWCRSDFGRSGPPWVAGHRRQMDGWTSLCAPPVHLGSTNRTPRRAPNGCPPLGSEVAERQAGLAPLPASCALGVAPEPVEVAPGGPAMVVDHGQGVPAREQRLRANRSSPALDQGVPPVQGARRRGQVGRLTQQRLEPAADGGRAGASAPHRVELSDRDVERVANAVARQLQARHPEGGQAGRAARGGDEAITLPQLRRELARVVQRRAGERVEDLAVGAVLGAGGALAVGAPDKLLGVLGDLGQPDEPALLSPGSAGVAPDPMAGNRPPAGAAPPTVGGIYPTPIGRRPGPDWEK